MTRKPAARGGIAMSDDNVIDLVPINRTIPFSIPEPGSPVDKEVLISNLPDLLEWSLSCLLSEFDYEANALSGTAKVTRILAVTADRLRRVI